jgi:hypothetical protein
MEKLGLSEIYVAGGQQLSEVNVSAPQAGGRRGWPVCF